VRKSLRWGCAALLAAAPVRAQSAGDFAAWTGIFFTPVGALPGLELPSGGTTDRRTQLGVQVASWKFEGDEDRNTNFGIKLLAPMGTKARFGATLGWMEPGGGGNGVLIGGVDVGAPVWVSATTEPTAVSIDVKGSLGFGHFTADGGGANSSAWSLVGSVPIKIRHTLASKAMVSGFVGLGFGFAGVSDDTDSESGTRPMISLGGAWTSAGGVGIHLGGQKVIIDSDPGDFPWVWALGGTFPMGARK
jgi:hypothetical protein